MAVDLAQAPGPSGLAAPAPVLQVLPIPQVEAQVGTGPSVARTQEGYAPSVRKEVRLV